MTKMLLLLLGLLGACQGQDQLSECSDSEMQETNSEFNQCAVQLEYQFEERKDTAEDETGVETAACSLISETVTECGKAWDKCYTEEEVLRLHDMHLESLLAQHSSLSLSGCSLVEEYLESGRREENVDQDARCSDRRSIQGQQKFQTCSHAESTKAYDNIIEMDDSEKIKTILCDTLGRIGLVCTKELEECFSTEDLARTTKSHLLEMKKFLVSFAEGKISEDELAGCGVFQAIESEDSETVINDDPYDDEESELAEISSSEPDDLETKIKDHQNELSTSATLATVKPTPSREMREQAEPLKNAVPIHAEQNTQKQTSFTEFGNSCTFIQLSALNICICLFVLYQSWAWFL